MYVKSKTSPRLIDFTNKIHFLKFITELTFGYKNGAGLLQRDSIRANLDSEQRGCFGVQFIWVFQMEDKQITSLGIKVKASPLLVYGNDVRNVMGRLFKWTHVGETAAGFNGYLSDALNNATLQHGLGLI